MSDPTAPPPPPRRPKRTKPKPAAAKAVKAVGTAVKEAVKTEKRRRTLAEWAVVVLVVIGVLAVGVFGVGRWGVLTPAGRGLVSSFVNGKKADPHLQKPFNKGSLL